MKRWKKQEQRKVYFVLAYFRTRFRTGSQLKAHFNMWKYLSRKCITSSTKGNFFWYFVEENNISLERPTKIIGWRDTNCFLMENFNLKRFFFSSFKYILNNTKFNFSFIVEKLMYIVYNIYIWHIEI